MMQMKISGNMLEWIKLFLTDRTYQVKVGNVLSENYKTDNGTPQGSPISPLLFLIMINDYPKLSEFTSDAFFADDNTVWRSGKNLPQIVYHLQQDLEVINDWCLKWIFIINTDKTTCIVFTKKRIKQDEIKLNI